jgi:hypothetical protein
MNSAAHERYDVTCVGRVTRPGGVAGFFQRALAMTHFQRRQT